MCKSETGSVKELKFCELKQDEQIEKLRYELQIALRAISHIGNKIVTLEEHQHNVNGKVLIALGRINRAFQPDRSNHLN